MAKGFDPPFVIYEPFRKGKHMEGKDQWTGFAMELLKHLSKMNHFDYVIKPVEDRKFGTFDETKGRWDGLIGELIYKRSIQGQSNRRAILERYKNVVYI
ncbi:hypothetical protein X801_08486 [Opisthorchis viverrini]|uniref:Ionotropic glutamate receptor L-glutamate and glycine-binding domain-containing protein n=1 Tax=Opisthorchis viverrini TaxID=6198 RepID=A0A1S8WML4_OPIVI|nr:hypothetical protein X801_08486 [Opisthorchis viverrini]